MKYVARCQRCTAQVEVETKPGLEEMIDILDGKETCPSGRGHSFTQVLPP